MSTIVAAAIPKLLAAAALLAAACSPGQPAGAPDASPGGPVRTDRVEVYDNEGPQTEWGYDPPEIEVPAGTTVTFFNSGSELHTVTEDAERLFDIATPVGESVTYTFETPGTFPYHCGLHPDMKGVIHVCDGECD